MELDSLISQRYSLHLDGIAAFVILFSCVQLPNSAWAQADADAKPKVEECVFEMPTLEGWAITEPRPFESKDAGFTFGVNCEDPRITVTIYQFNRGIESIFDALNSEEIKKEMQGVKDAIEQAQRLGYYETVTEKQSSSTKRIGDSKTEALWVQYEIENRGETTDSQCYLTTCKNRFVKIRITRENTDAAKEKLPELMNAIGSAIEKAKE